MEIRKEGETIYRFVIKSERGHPLLESVDFPNPAMAQDSVRRLQPQIQNPRCIERKTDHNGQFHFTLRDPEGTVLGHSQAYRSEAGMENGIKNTLNRIADWNSAL